MPRLAAVLLAAGSSSRLGQAKQLLKLDGESLVRRAARLLVNLEAQPIVVVTGHRSADIAAELPGLPLTVVDNPDWALGMGGSIACGMHNIPGEVDGVLLMLCDQWKLGLRDLTQLKSKWESDISRIVTAQWKEKNSDISGPPVIFPGDLIHELKFINKGMGAKPLIDQNRRIVSVVEMENATWDLDSPEDLELLGRV